MRTTILTALALGVLGATAPAASADSAAYDQIVMAAQKVRDEATEVKLMLRHRAADQAVLQQRLSLIESHAQSLKSAIAGLDVSEAGLTSRQLEALERAKAATDTMLVLLANKATLLASPTALDKQRGLLRAKADGIAQRALLVERQVERMRSS